jgi:O-antigen/teichoic acid export membrane protein
VISKLKIFRQHQGWMRYFHNTSWLMGERILRMSIGLFVGIWVARYLGPERFGLLSYAQSFVFLFSTIATLGLDGIVVRELVRDEKKRDILLGTSFGLKLFGAVLILPLLAIAVQLTSNDKYTNLLVFIIASAAIFQSFNVIGFYYQSKVLSKYVALSNTISLVLSSIVKIALILNEAPLIAFAIIVLFDAAVLAAGLFFYYQNTSNLKIFNWVFEWRTARLLLKESWWVMLAGAAILVYMKIDQVMIKEMIDTQAVGQYAAAARLSEVWYFIPVIIVGSLFPAIVNSKTVSEELFYERLRRLYTLMIWLAIFVAIPVAFLSDWVVTLLYGNDYRQAGSVLKIHIWACVFVFLSVANDQWFYVTGRLNLLATKVLVGATANILLNLYLIPGYGIYGAAIATLISYSISVLWSDLIFRSLRHLFYMKFVAIVPSQFVSIVMSILKCSVRFVVRKILPVFRKEY